MRLFKLFKLGCFCTRFFIFNPIHFHILIPRDPSNKELSLAAGFINFSHRNIFLTGKAGTGKTTFLKSLKEQCQKRHIVVAPTGVAAMNAGGVTIHSFFQLNFGPNITTSVDPSASNPAFTKSQYKYSKEKINIIRSLDLLIIDEISMVRADVLDGIDEILKRFRHNNKPFGGVQLLMIGDLQQLAPIIKDDEWSILSKYYVGPYFFNSLGLSKTDYLTLELKKIYRQNDIQFIDLLNEVRENTVSATTLEVLNQRYEAAKELTDTKGIITLTTHNHQAKQINDSHLAKINEPLHEFKAKITGDFAESIYPVDAVLQLKEGAQVMFLRNDSAKERQYYNGKIGIVKEIDQDNIFIVDENENVIEVNKVDWENIRYTLDPETKAIKEEILGVFTHFPLKLAWAITIHKSQGLTFERLLIDANASFAHGQVYVALSRCKSLNGLYLKSKLNRNSIINDTEVHGFIKTQLALQPDETELEKSKQKYCYDLILELIDFQEHYRIIRSLYTICNENQSIIIGNLKQRITILTDVFINEIYNVSLKFKKQMDAVVQNSPDIISNQALQDRIQKGAAYFSQKLHEHFISTDYLLEFETDNHQLINTLNNNIESLRLSVKIKQAVLLASINGFSVPNYLQTKAKASLDEPAPLTKKKKTATPDTSVCNHPGLYNRLVDWNFATAAHLDVDAYMVLQKKTMFEIAHKLPASLRELKAIKGMGDKKLKLFGAELMELIDEYKQDKGMPIELTASAEMNFENPKKSAADTFLMTLELFKSGLGAPEIALQRQLSISTIEKHLAQFVEKGDIDVFQLLPKEKVNQIMELFEIHGTDRLSPVKAELGDTASYSEIRYVAMHMQFLMQ